ncbi:hypothetical protein, partial [Vibrio diabolicus]|uniref:hypothetical protein n=1 Tax=Vibrio diabolicus TaxID=50719 RepID=UPI003D7D9B0C
IPSQRGLNTYYAAYYANYVTGYPFKAILSPSHHGKPDLVKSHHPPFVHSRLSANPQHNS